MRLNEFSGKEKTEMDTIFLQDSRLKMGISEGQ